VAFYEILDGAIAGSKGLRLYCVDPLSGLGLLPAGDCSNNQAASQGQARMR